MQVPVVPHGCPAAFSGDAVMDPGAGDMPEGVAQIKKAVPDRNVTAFFQGGFAVSGAVEAAV